MSFRTLSYSREEFDAVDRALREARSAAYKRWSAAHVRGEQAAEDKALLATYDGLLTKSQSMRGSS